MSCRLCNCTTSEFELINDRKYVQCLGCRTILLASEHHLSSRAEKIRYDLHDNNIHDSKYINFVEPLIRQIKHDFTKENAGLDFGCGPGPVITSELEKSGYKISLYDPYFKPDDTLLKKQFHFIICCEVMEHFNDPLREFKLLYDLLLPEGKLYCKTALWHQNINFKGWHYKNDPTHVIFYSEETLFWIKEHLDFNTLEIYDDLFVFTK